MITVMAERLYEDIKFVTQQNPTQIVDDDGARAYNSLLARAKKEYPSVEVFDDFPTWSPRTIKYKDALVVAGQLFALLNALTERQSGMSRALTSQTASAFHRRGGPQPQPQVNPSAPQAPQRPPQQQPQGSSNQTEASFLSAPTQVAPPPQEAPRPQQPQAPKPRQSGAREQPLDEELYGSAGQPPRRNEDGTIPFSLD